MTFRESDMFTLKYVKAGQAGKILALSSKDISSKEFDEAAGHKIEKYYNDMPGGDVFIVVGESMAQEFVHTEDILLVANCEVNSLNNGDLIVLIVDDKSQNVVSKMFKGNLDWGHKLRKFIMHVDLNETEEELYRKLCEEDVETKFSKSSKETFKIKYKKAIGNITDPNDKKDVLLSITYTEKGRDYSFHTSKLFCAKVNCILQKKTDGKYHISQEAQ